VAVDHVGRVPGAPHPDLDHPDVHRAVGERGVGHRHQHLEETQLRPAGDRAVGVDQVQVGRDLVVHLDEPLRIEHLAVDRDPLPHVVQVRADEPSGPQAVLAQQPLDHPGGRGLPVRAGDVHRLERLLRVAEQPADGGDPVQARHQIVLRRPGEDRLVHLAQPLLGSDLLGGTSLPALRTTALDPAHAAPQ
jgi:hypothetical protein